jgi:ABC-type sugar transport system ATPase subunit/ribose/xylose/arabinose/galactoside ABC-type transport system permease subunit
MATIEIRGLTKRYGGVLALDGVDLDIAAGEVHAVCGENGAGKSTLNKILAGMVEPTSGTVKLDGRAVSFGSVTSAEAAGISMVHQESAVFLSMSAVENHQLMREPTKFGGLLIDRAEMKARTQAALQELGETFDLDLPLEQRSLAQRQMVMVARALATDCRLLILDEPTASLSSRETDALFRSIRAIRDKGVAVMYVSHRMDEIFALADRVTVLRDGRHVMTRPIAEVTPADLVQAMVGREVAAPEIRATESGPVRLRVTELSSPGKFSNINFEVRGGEVVALAGLVGAGRSEVARAIFGIDRFESGEVWIDGDKIALVPEDRQHEGLHLPFSLRDNMAMAPAGTGLIPRAQEAEKSRGFMQRLAIKAPSDEVPAQSLSGGNQQKVLLGKWLATKPNVLILDEPTRGVDVGAKAQIHELVAEIAASGVAVLVISSELKEVLGLGDRILVMRDGQISGELSRQEATQEKVLALALPAETGFEASAPTILPTKGLRPEVGVGGLLIATLALAAGLNPQFLAVGNILDMLVKVAPALIVGCAMTLVILAREIDISVGSLMGLCAACLGVACSTDRMGLPVPVGVGICLGVGVLGGLINGLLVTFGRVPSIIVTLGMLTILRGVTERTMGGKWIEKLPEGLRSFGTGNWLGLPYSVLMAIAFALFTWWLAKGTRFGVQVFALGSNPSAAKFRGVPEHRIKLCVFMLAGLAAGIAALFSATQLQIIESGFGSGFELVAIASVIVGGTSIQGGRGTVLGTVLGAITLGIVSTVLIFLKLGDSATYWERAIQGGFILVAILGDQIWRRRTAR